LVDSFKVWAIIMSLKNFKEYIKFYDISIVKNSDPNRLKWEACQALTWCLV
jgi:hypothetical protein